MSATTALGAAPLVAADEPTDVAAFDRQEEQKAAEDAEKQAVAEVDAEDTAEVSEEDTVIAGEAAESTLTPALSPGEREEVARRAAAERVRQTAALPPGLRDRLAALVESGGQIGGAGQALVSLDEAIRAVAESLPSALRIGGDVSRPEHPSGESFFTARGEGEISDQQAEEIARGQLARSGLLRGQRVRVAQD